MRRRVLRGTVAVVALAALAVAGVAALLTWVVPERVSETCTVTLADGGRQSLDADQADNAALITAVTVRRQLPARAATIALATAVQESKLRNIDYGDRDSLGLFQQRPSQGWGTPEQVLDPHYATNAFLDGLVAVPDYTALPVTEAAQRVQRSAFPEAYADHEPEGRAFASALTGNSPAALTCRLPMPPEGDDDAVATAVVTRLQQDYGVDATVEEGVVVVDAARLPGDDEARLAWSVAQWAVATAAVTGATTVEVADQVWERADGNAAQWRPAGTDLAVGTVRIS